MNKVFLIGRITKDPEIKYTPSGAGFCVFALAVDRDYKAELYAALEERYESLS